MAVTMQRCIAAMTQAAGRPLTDDEIERVAMRLQERVEALRRSRGSASDNELLRDAAAELGKEAAQEAALMRRSALYQARSYAALRGLVDRFDDPAEALRAILGGLNTPGAPSRFSVDYRGKALADEYTGALVAGLRAGAPDDRLLAAFMRGDLDRAIAAEMWAMQPGHAGPGHAGVTGDKDALAIARILHNTQEDARLRANRAGAWIDALPGYVVRQSHDSLRLRRAGFDAWRQAIEPLLDDTTFERAQARVDQLEAERAAAIADRDQASIDTKALPRTLTPYARRIREELARNTIAGAERDAYLKVATRLENLNATAESADLQRQASRLQRDAYRALEKLDRSYNRVSAIGEALQGMVDDINAIADRRRRAAARAEAADNALENLRFGGRVDDRETFLRAVYDDIVSGRTMLPEGSGSYVTGIGGSSNLAAKVSRERVLQFRDADAWMNYHEQFGRPGNLATAAWDGLSQMGRKTALIETLGPNPVANFTRLRRHLEDAHHDKPDTMTDLRSTGIDHLLQWVTGEARAVENPTLASIGAVVRGWNALTKLGGMVISSITDVVGLAAEAKFQGKGYLAGYRQSFEDLLHGRGSGERREISDIAGAGLEGMTGAIGARLSAVDDVPGMMSWAMKKMYSLNVGAWWTDSHKIGATMMQMRGWARDVGRGFEQLDTGQKRLFNLYGIGPAEWDLLRASRAREANGRTYLVPAELRKLPTEEVSRILGRELTDFDAVRALDDAGDRFATLLADRADFAVPTPGAREMAAMYGGHRPGSPWGEALRLFWQFKQFPVSVLTKPLSQIRANAESRVAAATSIAAFFVQSAAMGYVAMSLKDVLKNKEPRHPDDPRTWLAAAAQGGGIGIYGDYLFGEFDRFGHSAGDTLLGPTLGGLAPDVVSLWAKAIRGELKSSEAVRFGVNNTPFANLFYVKPVLDTLILSDLYERLNPGYRQRAERQMQRDEGRGFLFHP